MLYHKMVVLSELYIFQKLHLLHFCDEPLQIFPWESFFLYPKTVFSTNLLQFLIQISTMWRSLSTK